MHIPVTATNSSVYRNIPDGYSLRVSFAKNLRRLRLARDLRQEDLAEKLGVQQGAVSRWEKGKTLPDPLALPKLATALRASLDELLEGVDAQYDARRDLPGHVRTGQKTPHQGGRADVPAEARAEIDRLRTVVEDYEARFGEMHDVASRLVKLAALGSKKERAAALAQSKGGQRDRKTS